MPISKETKLEVVFSRGKLSYLKHRMLKFLFLFVILLCYSVKMATLSFFFKHDENN